MPQTVVTFCLGIAGLESAAQASGREQVPPAPDRPWVPPNLPAYENALRKGPAKALEKGKHLVNCIILPMLSCAA